MLNSRLYLFAAALWTGFILSAGAYAKEVVKIPGAGPSTQVVKLFFAHFALTNEGNGYEFVVPPRSIKHAGGIAASDELIFGRTGRPLRADEKGANKEEVILAKIPVTFTVGEGAGVKRISLANLKGIFAGKIINWKQLGGADHRIVLIGREPTEAAYITMKRSYPFLAEAPFSRIFKRDHQVVNYLKAPEGAYALSFGAAPNFDEKYILKVEGFTVGVGVGLVYDLRNAENPLLLAVRYFAGSDAWRHVIDTSGFLPPS